MSSVRNARAVRLSRLSALLLCVLATRVFAAAPYAVTDLKAGIEGPVGSGAYYVGTVGGAALFGANSRTTHAGLWRTDGTAEGTFPLVKSDEGSVRGFITEGDRAYFSASDSGGFRVWKTDGTRAGTVAITPALSSCVPAAVLPAPIGGDRIVCFEERSLKVIDGATTTELARSSSHYSSSMSAARLGRDALVGTDHDLWKTNGTVSGTVKLRSGGAWNLTAAADRVFFSAEGELWVSDGTPAGTRMVTDLHPGSGSTFADGADGAYDGDAIITLGDRVVFIGAHGDLGWSDGTAAGTRLFRTGRSRFPPTFTVLNGVAYFGYDDGVHGYALWRSNGTEGGTWILREEIAENAGVWAIVAGASRIYYYHYGGNATGRFQLFESDGTPAGTRAMEAPPRNFFSGGVVESLVTVGDTVYFSADHPTFGNEPWVGEPGGSARMIANVAAESAGSSRPRRFVASSDRLYFVAESDTRRGVWSTDGTSAGTVLALERSGAGSDFDHPQPFAAVGGTLYLSKNGELWTSRGTPGSEALLETFKFFWQGTAVRGRVYLDAVRGTSGEQLWTTDGTRSGTRQLTHFDGEGPGESPVAFADRDYFVGGAYSGGGESMALYATDGTPEGTHSIARITDRRWRLSGRLVPLGGSLLLFGAGPYTLGLLKFSGAAAEATVVREFPSWTVLSGEASIGSAVLFLERAHDRLWRTDGTAEGTVVIREFKSIYTNMDTPFLSLGDRVVFTADDGVHGKEPWVSDGTPGGTRLLRDILAGPGTSDAGATDIQVSAVAADGIAYFAATDAEHGRELWQTDGTPEGTRLVADVEPGPASSSPAELTRVGDVLYFAATTAAIGTELWAYPLPETPAITIDDVRVAEDQRQALVPVRLTRAWSHRVTVAYDVQQETATLTFEPGETRKTVAVPVADDLALGGIRAVTVRLHDANVAIEKTTGTVVIEDDDIVTDVALSIVVPNAVPLLQVRNDGPSPASNVRVCSGTVPSDVSLRCREPFELLAGESRTFPVTGDGMLVARVTQWERDTDPKNNELTLILAGALQVAPANPRVGQQGTIAMTQKAVPSFTFVRVTSSDPSIVGIPSGLTFAPNETRATTRFLALRSGTATIIAESPSGTFAATVRVGSARMEAFLDLDASSGWRFGAANELSATVRGLTPGGATPSGSVSFFDDGKLLASVPVTNQQAKLSVATALPGTRRFTATYGGDASFAETASAPLSVTVGKGVASPRARWIAETSRALVILSGAPGFTPSGTITVDGVTHALDASGSAVIDVLPGARTAILAYSGDALYESANVNIAIERERTRGVRH